MSSLPWEPDRLLTLDGARAAISARFPAVDARQLTHLGSGWEFDAFLTRDNWVFRFPRRAYCAEFFEPEKRVHQLVAAVLPPHVAVPHVELLGEPTEEFPYRFAGHRFIPGIAADELDPHLRPVLAREIAAAFGAIHSIPERTAREAGIGEFDVDDLGRKEWFDRGLRVAAELHGLDAIVDQAVSWLHQVPVPLGRFEGPLYFIHHDMGPEHCIVDPASGRLSGIIDWTDAILGDAARDFVVLVTALGWSFTEDVLRSYPLPIDDQFRDRLDFMARLLSVMWLTEACERHANVPKHVHWVRNAFIASQHTPTS